MNHKLIITIFPLLLFSSLFGQNHLKLSAGISGTSLYRVYINPGSESSTLGEQIAIEPEIRLAINKYSIAIGPILSVSYPNGRVPEEYSFPGAKISQTFRIPIFKEKLSVLAGLDLRYCQKVYRLHTRFESYVSRNPQIIVTPAVSLSHSPNQNFQAYAGISAGSLVNFYGQNEREFFKVYGFQMGINYTFWQSK